MSTYISEDVIQRALISTSDLIQNKLIAQSYKAEKCVVLSASLNAANAAEAIVNQQQLFSDSLITSNASKEIFADNTSNLPIDATYTLKHNFMFRNFEPAGGSIGRDIYSFDVDEVNRKNDGKFFIDKIKIKDMPKDSYTLKTNHQISLKVYFSSFEDLLEENLEAKKYDGTTKKFPFLILLYKFLKIGREEARELPDTSGVYLIQKLIFSNDDRYKSIKASNGVLYKNYHLTYHKHSFDFGKDTSPFFEIYKNELTIDFMAFETDGVDKTAEVSNMDGNLYLRVLDEAQKEKIKKINEKIQELTTQISYCTSVTANSATIKDLNDKLNEALFIRQKLFKNINEDLVRNLLTSIKTYELTGLTYDTLNIYKEATVDFASLIGGLALVGAIAAAFFIPAAGAAVGSAALSIAGPMAIQMLIGSLQNTLFSGDFNLGVIRNQIKNGEVKNMPADMVAGKLKYLHSTAPPPPPGVTPTTPTEVPTNDKVDQKHNEELEEMFGDFFSVELQAANTEPVSLYFLPFGEILKIFNQSCNRVHMIVGGYIFKNETTNTFVNFANIPISLSRFANFLYRFIIQRERGLKYSTELFLRDCFENLIKNSLYDANGYLEKRAGSVSKDMKMSITVHAKSDQVQSFINNHSSVPLSLLETKFQTFLQEFLKTKNISGVLNETEISKIIVIGTYDNVIQYDFLKLFKETHAGTNFFGQQFQNWMHEKRIPCILMKKIATTETILKKKHLSFTRLDNPNVMTGNIIASKAVLRTPYKISGELKSLFCFFINPGSFVMVAPPSQLTDPDLNMFGIGGMYLITETDFEYSFQRIQDDKITLPNFDSRYTIQGTKLSIDAAAINRAPRVSAPCSPASAEGVSTETSTSTGTSTGSGTSTSTRTSTSTGTSTGTGG